jgi:hypothetical protein
MAEARIQSFGDIRKIMENILYGLVRNTMIGQSVIETWGIEQDNQQPKHDLQGQPNPAV